MSRAWRSETGRRAGFTIIEVVVVLLILAVATAAAVPALLRDRVDDEMAESLRAVDTLFRTARDSAVRSGMRITVAIDSATSRVWIISGTDEPTAVSLPELPAGVRLQLSAARANFVFSPAGAAFADTLVLRGRLTERSVTLDPWTGHAMLH